MKAKALLTTSLVANVILLVIVGYLVKQEAGDLSFAAPVIVCTTHAKPASVDQTVADKADVNGAGGTLAQSQGSTTNR
jgi:hypothetical protein